MKKTKVIHQNNWRFLNKNEALEVRLTMEKLWFYGKKNYSTMAKLWYYGKKTYDTISKTMKLSFTMEKAMVLWKKQWYYSKL